MARHRIWADDYPCVVEGDFGCVGMSVAARHLYAATERLARQALAVGAIPVAIHAARVIFNGTADSDCDIQVAAVKDTP